MGDDQEIVRPTRDENSLTHPRAGTPETNFDTPLKPEEQAKFQQWKAHVAPNDSGGDYDLPGAYLNGVIPDPQSGHFPDTFKKPNHPTFSNESQYAEHGNPGHWEDDKYIAPRFSQDKTSPVIDRGNGSRVRVSEDDLPHLILDGSVGYAPEHRVNVIDPDGKVSNVGGDYLRYALSQGFTLENSKQAAGREYAAQHSGLSGAALTALSQFTDEALFGLPEQIFDKTGNEYDIARKDALKKEHEVANALGGIAGFATSMLYGGEVTGGTKAAALTERAILGTGVKGAEKAVIAGLAERLTEAGVGPRIAKEMAPGLAQKVAAKAAAMGVESTALASPSAITEAALGDPEKAAEHLLVAFGTGAALGGVGKLIGSGIEAAAPKLSGLAEDQAFRALNYSKNGKGFRMADELPGGVKGVGRTLLDEELVKQPGEEFEGLTNRISERRNQVGQNIKSLYTDLDKIDSKVKLPSTGEFAGQFRSQIVDPLAKVPGNENVVNKLTAYINNFESKGGNRNLTFKEMHEWRQALDDMIWREGQIGIPDPAKQQLAKIRGIITDQIEKTGDQVAGSIGKGFKSNLDQQNLLYRRLKVAEEMSAKSAEIQNTNRSFSPTDYGFGAALGVGALAHGNPFPLIKAIAGSTAHKYVRENGNAIAAKVLDRIGLNSKGLSLLRYGLDQGGNQAGLLMAERAVKQGGDQLDQIPGMLSRLSVKSAGKSAIVAAPTRLLSDKLLADHAQQVIDNREQLQQNIETLSGIIRDQGAPTIGAAYATKQQQTLQYILDSLPVQPPPDPFKPFQPPVSKADLTSLGRKLEVAEDWNNVLRHLENGTLTKDHLDAMAAVYPKMTGEILKRIDEHAQSGQMQPISYSGRTSIDRLRKIAPVAAAPIGTVPMKATKGAPAQPRIAPQQLFNTTTKQPKEAPVPRMGKHQLSALPTTNQGDDFSRVMNHGIGAKA